MYTVCRALYNVYSVMSLHVARDRALRVLPTEADARRAFDTPSPSLVLQPNSQCVCHYEGKLLSGKIFDSSIARGSPATFAPSKVIAGWTEALQLMKAGDKYRLTIPSHLAYGDGGAGSSIPGKAVLVFELEVRAARRA